MSATTAIAAPLSARTLPKLPQAAVSRMSAASASARSVFPTPPQQQNHGYRHHPRRRLHVQSQGGTGNRIAVLLHQLQNNHSFEVQRAAVQELMLLSRSSDACRIATLKENGDKALVKVANGTKVPSLLRWTFGALSTLAVDDWSRRRQTRAVERAFNVLGALGSIDDKEAPLVAVEAASLLQNLIVAEEPASVFERLGGVQRLAAWATDRQQQEVIEGRAAGDAQEILLRALESAGFTLPPRLAITPSPRSPPQSGGGNGERVSAFDKTPRGFARVANGSAPPPANASNAPIVYVAEAELHGAVQLQSGYRGHVARGTVRAKRARKRTESTAATRVQARQRGRTTRREIILRQQQQHLQMQGDGSMEEEEGEEEEEERVAPPPIPHYPTPPPDAFGVRPKNPRSLQLT